MSERLAPDSRPSAVRIALAFFAIYVLWGTNYLAIRYALEGMPPLLMMGLRCLIAGMVLLAWGWLQGWWPTLRQLLAAVPAGALLFLGGHGLLAVAQTRVSSGVAALAFGSVPIWMVALGGGGSTRSPGRLGAGLLMGFAGLALLLAPRHLAAKAQADPAGVLILVAAAGSWAAGSIQSARARLPHSPAMRAGLLLAVGAALLVPTAVSRGEEIAFGYLPAKSLAGFAYMVLCGSLLCFAAYVWLLQVRGAAQVGAYTFVNPLVAVLVGCGIAGESLDQEVTAACVLIVSGVALVHSSRVAPTRPRD